jgi:peptidoglycan hydrolase CwlO-like protein
MGRRYYALYTFSKSHKFTTMLNSFPEWLVNILTASIASLVTYFSTRKKENIEVQGSALDNVDKAVKLWQDTAERMSQRVDELSDKVDILTKEVQSLRVENADLKLKLGISNENNKIKPKGNRPNKE